MEKEKDLMELVKRRGFFWPSFEIYGGVGGFYDMGPLGVLLKNKIIQKWREIYQMGEGFQEIDSPTIMPEEVLKASGHVEHFSDIIAKCKHCGATFKAVDLISEATGKDVEGNPVDAIREFMESQKIKCPECKGNRWDLSTLNAMFQLAIGSENQRIGYLRPETAQGIFINFKRLQRIARGKLPFGVIQIGRGYRNEISPRKGIIRLREFTMAEAEVFFDPEEPDCPRFSQVVGEKLRLWLAKDEEKGVERLTEVTVAEAADKKIVCNKLMGYYLALTKRFLTEIGIPEEAIRFREQTPGQRAHYSVETWDAEVSTKRFGWVEVAGLAYRTEYDLSQHSKSSGEDLTVFSSEKGKKILPHVIEPSYGIERPIYCVLEHSYTEEGKRKYLKLKKEIAPIDAGVFPLTNQGKLPGKALDVHQLLKGEKLMTEYDDSGSIGRRYARADEIGVPYCITVDHQTLEDDCVTIRDRDTTQQIRVKIEKLPEILQKLLSGKIEFLSAGELVK